MKYPRLAAMRAQAQRREDEIAAPHRAAVDHARQIAREERTAREGLERLLRSPIIKQVVEKIGHEVGDHVYHEIMKAIASQRGFAATTTIEVPTSMLMAADPKSIVSRVVDWWKRETAPKMRVRAMADVATMHHTVIDIRLPEMGYREAVMNDF